MINTRVAERKLTINDKEYTFRLDFEALIKFEKKYENAIEIFNEFLKEKSIYGTAIKILSCSCVEKDFTEEELAKSLGFNLPTMNLIDDITFYLVLGSVQEGTDTEKEITETEKNE